MGYELAISALLAFVGVSLSAFTARQVGPHAFRPQKMARHMSVAFLTAASALAVFLVLVFQGIMTPLEAALLVLLQSVLIVGPLAARVVLGGKYREGLMLAGLQTGISTLFAAGSHTLLGFIRS